MGAIDDAIALGWRYEHDILSHAETFILVHVPSLGEERAAHAAMMHLALARDEACLLRLAPKPKPTAGRGRGRRAARDAPVQMEMPL